MRNLTGAVQAQLVSQSVRPILLVSCAFQDQTIYVWSGVGTINWNGQNWLGVGTFGKLSTVGETTSLEAQGIVLTLSGVNPTLLNEALSEMTTAGQGQVYLGFLDIYSNLITSPIPLFLGLMDQPEIDLDTNTATINFSVENRLSDLQRARGGRYTDQDQRARYPADGGLQYVTWLQDEFFNWKG